MRTLMIAVALVMLTAVAGGGQVTVVEERIQDLPLSDAQEAKIAEIRKESGPKVQEAIKSLKALAKSEMEKIQGVLTAEQKDKVKAMKEDREERREGCLAHAIANLKELDLTEAETAKIEDIRKQFRPKLIKSMKELHGLLSEEQRKVREDALTAGKKHTEVLKALKLTDEQKEKVAGVCKSVGGFVREEMEEIRDILTASQKEKLAELKDERKEHARDRMAHRIANFKDLNLTEEQRTKIATIRNEYRPKIQEAGNRVRGLVRDEVESIVAVIKK